MAIMVEPWQQGGAGEGERRLLSHLTLLCCLDFLQLVHR